MPARAAPRPARGPPRLDTAGAPRPPQAGWRAVGGGRMPPTRAWLLALVLAIAPSGPAAAFAHLWDFVEIYSNADGSVQFVEMFTTARSETLLPGLEIGRASCRKRAHIRVFVNE